MTDVVQETTDLLLVVRNVVLLAPLIGLLVTWMLTMLLLVAFDYLGRIDITRLLRRQDQTATERRALAIAVVACSCFTVILMGKLIGALALLTTGAAHLYFYGWKCQSAEVREKVKLAAAAVWNKLTAPSSSAAAEAVLAELRALRKEVAELAQWLSLPEELRRQRPQLVEAVTTSAERLNAAIELLQKQSFAAGDIAHHIDGLRKHGISEDLLAGLEAVLSNCKGAIEAQQHVLAHESLLVTSASDELNQHLAECARKRPTAQEALAQAEAAMESARRLLLKS